MQQAAFDIRARRTCKTRHMAQILRDPFFELSTRKASRLLYSLQNLRALAAYAVVAYHLSKFLGAETTLPISDFNLGAAGVDLFFVLSGFVMIHVTSAHENWPTFMLKRIARVVPLYWLATIATIIMVQLAPWTFPTADMSWSNLLRSLFFLPGLDSAGTLKPLLYVGWTLNFEFLFYALFAISLKAPAKHRFAVLGGLVLSVLAAGNLASGLIFNQFYGNPLLLEFLAGAGVASLLKWQAFKAWWKNAYVWFVWAALGVGALIAIGLEHKPTSDERIFYYGIPALLLVFACASGELTNKPVKRSVLSWLGDTSYSAYLLHPFLISIVGVITVKLTNTGVLGAVAATVSIVTATVIAAWMSYEIVERPAARLVRAAGHKLGQNKTLATYLFGAPRNV